MPGDSCVTCPEQGRRRRLVQVGHVPWSQRSRRVWDATSVTAVTAVTARSGPRLSSCDHGALPTPITALTTLTTAAPGRRVAASTWAGGRVKTKGRIRTHGKFANFVACKVLWLSGC